MSKTWSARWKFILEDAPSVEDILKEWPAYRNVKHVSYPCSNSDNGLLRKCGNVPAVEYYSKLLLQTNNIIRDTLERNIYLICM